MFSSLRHRRPAPWPADRPLRFVTSFSDVLYEASGRRCLETFRKHNPEYELWAFVEAADDAVLMDVEQEVETLRATVVRLSSLPLLSEFLAVARDLIPREFGGDAAPELFPGEGPETGDVWFRKKCIPDRFRWALGGVIDDLPVAARLMAGAETKEGLERGVWVSASVVAEDALV